MTSIKRSPLAASCTTPSIVRLIIDILPVRRPKSRASVSGTAVMLLVRFVRSDRKMKARLGEIIFKVSEWIAVIVSLRGGLEKLSREQSGIAKAEVESFIHLVFADQIEFVADVTASAGAGWNRNRSAAGVEIVV